MECKTSSPAKYTRIYIIYKVGGYYAYADLFALFWVRARELFCQFCASERIPSEHENRVIAGDAPYYFFKTDPVDKTREVLCRSRGSAQHGNVARAIR